MNVNPDLVLGQLYDSVLDPTRLRSALEAVDKWLGSDLCHLVGLDRDESSVRLSLMTTTTLSDSDTAAFQKTYSKYFHEIDPRRQLARQMVEGHIFACNFYFDERYAQRSEFYQDFLRPFGARYVAGGCLYRDRTQEIYVAFNHMRGRSAFTDEDVSQIRYIAPHLQRVVKLLIRLESFRSGLYAGEYGLNSLDQAVIVLDTSDAIMFANQRATALLNEEAVLRSRSSKLHAIREDRSLCEALSRVRMSRHSESISLKAVDSLHGNQRIYLTIIGIPRNNENSHLHLTGDKPFAEFPNADLIVLINSPQKSSVVTAKQLMQLFLLTAAEARLAHALARGASVDEYADEACISIPTVRTHLRSVLKKTGERKLQDLVRILATLPSVSQ